jgi:hypothetical protein
MIWTKLKYKIKRLLRKKPNAYSDGRNFTMEIGPCTVNDRHYKSCTIYMDCTSIPPKTRIRLGKCDG